MSISLPDLFHEVPVLSPAVLPPVEIEHITADSRQVKPGSLFVAVKGATVDAHRFIPDVVRRGAAAVVGSQGGLQLPVPYIQVADARQSLAHLAAAYFGHPARKLRMLGITGTDGKTTTTNLVFQILQAAGLRAGMISTVNAVIGDQVFDTGFHVTTPDALDVQRYLAMMMEAGLTHCVLETTSHGWAQNRVDACEFDVALITNITHEHLNDHGSFENYRAAKARLFESLSLTRPKPWGNPRLAVLNRDDSSYEFLAPFCAALPGVKVLSYGLDPQADFRASQIAYAEGLRFWVSGAGFSAELRSSLVGTYNVSNILAAVSATSAGLGLPQESIVQGIRALKAIPGRMERIEMGQKFAAYVDFAHTPNALLRSLETARSLTSGRLICVFGSAGLRDRQKRVMMAEVAAQHADFTILTAEDPRTESLAGILAEMAGGAESRQGVEGQTFWRVPDRAQALRFAIGLAKPGDLVIACGKGHEQSMCFGTTEYPWDDRVAMRAALAEALHVQGPDMPFLPAQL